MSEWKVTYRGIVYPWHCDHMGHTNVMRYAGKFDEACWRCWVSNDPDSHEMEPGWSPYKREFHAGDAVTIQSALLEVKDKSVRMLDKMVHHSSEDVAATTDVTGLN